MSSLTRPIGAVHLAAKAPGPTIMVVSGVVSMGASVVVASKKTLEVESVLAPHVADLEKISHGESLQLESYDKNKAQKDRGRVYGRVTVDMVKLYFIPGVLFLGGAGLVFGGHHIMIKRNATLAIAFTGVQKAFAAYRERVVAEQGHEADQRFAHGHKVAEFYDDESGKTAVVSTRDWDSDGADPYNRVFARNESSQWVDDLGVNKLFVSNQQRMAQILLGNRGYLYLSDVYEALGFPETDISRVVGWKVTYLPDGSRDIPVVDFGLDKPLPDDWKYGRDNAIYLDFNCQGLIVGGKVQKILEQA